MVNKGTKNLIGVDPGFSNQALENSLDALKVGWVSKSFDLDQTIANNTVLTTSQKTDLKSTINNIEYLNLGRVFGDLLRHTTSILDGSIIPAQADVDNPVQATFIEILGSVQSLQTLIPQLYGETARAKKRSVNDHLGTLNKVLSVSTDSTQPTLTSLENAIRFISNANLSTETALETAYDNLRNFIISTRDDSTDFQQTLDTFATAVATAHTDFNNALSSEPYLSNRNALSDGRQKISDQVSLENSNVSGIRAYIDTLTDTSIYLGLAADEDVRPLLINITQNAQWKSYYENYSTNADYLNPIYTTDTDSDKSAVIDQVLADSGLPDVTDASDFNAVAEKAKRDERIDTAGFDRFTDEQIITKSATQLGLVTNLRSALDISQRLLNNMNQEDRDKIARDLDNNEDAETYS